MIRPSAINILESLKGGFPLECASDSQHAKVSYLKVGATHEQGLLFDCETASFLTTGILFLRVRGTDTRTCDFGIDTCI